MSCLCAYKLFYLIFYAKELIIPFGIHPFDICFDQPILWKYIKFSFILSYIFSNIILINIFCSRFNFIKIVPIKIKDKSFTSNSIASKNEKYSSDISSSNFNLLIGYNQNTNQKFIFPKKVYIKILLLQELLVQEKQVLQCIHLRNKLLGTIPYI